MLALCQGELHTTLGLERVSTSPLGRSTSFLSEGYSGEGMIMQIRLAPKLQETQ